MIFPCAIPFHPRASRIAPATTVYRPNSRSDFPAIGNLCYSTARARKKPKRKRWRRRFKKPIFADIPEGDEIIETLEDSDGLPGSTDNVTPAGRDHGYHPQLLTLPSFMFDHYLRNVARVQQIRKTRGDLWVVYLRVIWLDRPGYGPGRWFKAESTDPVCCIGDMHVLQQLTPAEKSTT